MVKSSGDIFHPLPCNANNYNSRAMTFDVPTSFRVRFTFHQFVLNGPNEYLEIGDGLFAGEETRLVRFSGTDTPRDVTTVTNAAWLRVKSSCKTEIPDFNLTIRAVNFTGIYSYS